MQCPCFQTRMIGRVTFIILLGHFGLLSGVYTVQQHAKTRSHSYFLTYIVLRVIMCQRRSQPSCAACFLITSQIGFKERYHRNLYERVQCPSICSRTGHSTGTNLDSYADDRNVVRGIAAGKALAGWSNVRASVNVPSFECIRSYDPATAKNVDSFIERLFVVSLPDFQPGGHLYRVLETCAASLVMYHNQVTTELNADNVISSGKSTYLRGCWSACSRLQSSLYQGQHRSVPSEGIRENTSNHIIFQNENGLMMWLVLVLRGYSYNSSGLQYYRLIFYPHIDCYIA
jgi:hypothetical protein